MPRLAQPAPHRLRLGRAAIAAVTISLGACLLPPASAAAAADPAGGTRAVGAPSGATVLSGKWTRPWAITFLPGGERALVTERFTAAVWLQASDGSKKMVGTVPHTVPPSPSGGKGGLLGVAPSPTWNGTTDKDVFFVHTAASAIRVARMHFNGSSLSDYKVVLGGITR